MTLFDTWDSYFTDNPRDPRISEHQRVLRNLVGARTAAELAVQEKQITLLRVLQIERGEVAIRGALDFTHHCAIHAHIDFLRAREIAMLTADSSALAAFLRRGVHRHG